MLGRLTRLLTPKPAPPRLMQVDEAFLLSDEYERLMAERLPLDGSRDLNEAENETRNYLFRHRHMRNRLGIFRWRGLQENRDLLLGLISKANRIVDFGGAACPLGFRAVVVDHLQTDAYGKPVPYHSLDQLPWKADLVFSSHTLEHIPDIEGVLAQLRDALEKDGHLVLHLPAYTCTRWWPGVHKNSRYHDHVHTFGLRGSQPPPQVPAYCEIDTLVGRYFTLAKAEYCGDNSIFILAAARTS